MNTRRSIRKALGLAVMSYVLIVMTIALSGCEAFYGKPRSAVGYGGEGSSSGTTLLGSDGQPLTPSGGGLKCPSSKNILPLYDIWVDGSMRFEACTGYNNSIYVEGYLTTDTKICVFPIQVIDSNNIYAKPDLNTGGLFKQCVSANIMSGFSEFSVSVQFPMSLKFNALLIAEGYRAPALEDCILNANVTGKIGSSISSCPAFSWGMLP